MNTHQNYPVLSDEIKHAVIDFFVYFSSFNLLTYVFFFLPILLIFMRIF